MANISAAQLLSWGTDAAGAFVRKKADLNATIAKIAEQNELNAHQISRVLEEANQHTVELLRSSGTANAQFPVAGLDGVLGLMHSQPKLASALDVQDVLPPARREGTLSKTAEAVVEVVKTNRRDADYDFKYLNEKIAQFRIDAEADFQDLCRDIEEIGGEIRKVARQHVLGDRGKFSDLLKVAHDFDPSNDRMWLALFGYLQKDLSEHFIKQGHPVSKDFVNEKVEIPVGDVRIINGRSGLCIYLDTLRNKMDKANSMARRILITNLFGDAIVDDYRQFKTNEDTDKVVNELAYSKLARAATGGYEMFETEFFKLAGVVGSAAKAVGKAAWKAKVPITAMMAAMPIAAALHEATVEPSYDEARSKSAREPKEEVKV